MFQKELAEKIIGKFNFHQKTMEEYQYYSNYRLTVAKKKFFSIT